MSKKKRKTPRCGSIERDCWSLDAAFFDWIVPRLRYLAKTVHGYPCSLESMEQWRAIINHIADGFDQCRTAGYFSNKHDKTKLNEAFRLFAKWHGAMWD